MKQQLQRKVQKTLVYCNYINDVNHSKKEEEK